MAQCDECGRKVKLNQGDVTCTDCSVALHNDCANWIEGVSPFCSECFNNISYNNYCSECETNSETRFGSGSYCSECDYWE